MRSLFRCYIFFYMFLLPILAPVAGFAGEFFTYRADFSVQVQNMEIPYKIMSIFVMPEEIVKLNIPADHAKSPLYSIRSSHGQIRHVKKNQWQWHAPKLPGLYSINISEDQKTDSILLNIFVMVPGKHQQGEHLNGYRIGNYPHIPFKGLPNYKPPPGFVEVTEENAETQISPHFRLKQFLCKQNSGYPKYLVLKEELLLKLELILQRVSLRQLSCHERLPDAVL